MKLLTVTCSTRPNRQGPLISEWFQGVAAKHGGFELELADLQVLGLPLFDEPGHPRMRQYVHDHTKAWSALVDAADAFVFVTPEYNFAPPPSFVNAVDYLFHEWNHKVAGFVSYAGASGGLRSAQMAKQSLTTVKVMPIPEGVGIPMFPQHLADGVFKGTEAHEQAALSMLNELARWATALKCLRSGQV